MSCPLPRLAKLREKRRHAAHPHAHIPPPPSRMPRRAAPPRSLLGRQRLLVVTRTSEHRERSPPSRMRRCGDAGTHTGRGGVRARRPVWRSVQGREPSRDEHEQSHGKYQGEHPNEERGEVAHITGPFRRSGACHAVCRYGQPGYRRRTRHVQTSVRNGSVMTRGAGGAAIMRAPIHSLAEGGRRDGGSVK